MFEISGKYTTAKVMIDDIDPETMRQITLMVNHPAVTNPVAIMPDCHAGKGCVIGFTMKVSNKAVPNFVGVDIGCGMISVPITTSKLTEGQLSNIDRELRKRVPMGKEVLDCADKTAKGRLSSISHMSERDIDSVADLVEMKGNRFWNSLGTLGGGNHFIEFGRDESGTVWVTIHTGSRNFGKKVCEFHDKQAQDRLRFDHRAYADFLKAKVKRGEIKAEQISGMIEAEAAKYKLGFDLKESAYTEGESLDSYMKHMRLAQAYATANRCIIIDTLLDVVSNHTGSKARVLDDGVIETIHNYISPEDGIVRKGAVASYVGRKMVIPFNMRDGLLICEGLSNPEWNFSAPHGAGRIMSRSKAKEVVSVEDYKESMAGIFTTSVNIDTLDESPMAYKDAAMIEAAIAPTAKILHRVKPIYNVKAGGE